MAFNVFEAEQVTHGVPGHGPDEPRTTYGWCLMWNDDDAFVCPFKTTEDRSDFFRDVAMATTVTIDQDGDRMSREVVALAAAVVYGNDYDCDTALAFGRERYKEEMDEAARAAEEYRRHFEGA